MGSVHKALFVMLNILDGNSEHFAHEWRTIGLLGEKKIRVVTALNLTKCLYQIE